MRELAEVLLRGPSSLSSGEREMIATLVSTRNECYFCQSSHRAAAARHLNGDSALVDAVRFDPAGEREAEGAAREQGGTLTPPISPARASSAQPTSRSTIPF